MTLPLRSCDAAASSESRCAVFALGSPHGDDRVPWLVADRLAELPGFADRTFKLVSPFEIVGHLDADVDVIVIDVCVSGAVAGTVVRVDESDFERLPGGTRTTHGGSLQESVELAAALGRRPRSLCVLAIEMETGAIRPGSTEASDRCIESLWLHLCAELSRLDGGKRIHSP